MCYNLSGGTKAANNRIHRSTTGAPRNETLARGRRGSSAAPSLCFKRGGDGMDKVTTSIRLRRDRKDDMRRRARAYARRNGLTGHNGAQTSDVLTAAMMIGLQVMEKAEEYCERERE